MTLDRIKLFAIVAFVLTMFAVLTFRTTPVAALTPAADDPAAAYKAKCAMCHSPKAEKFFDPAKSDDDLVQTILKGKKGEKPPYMPGYEAKGMTAEEAASLVKHMRGLKEPAK